MLTTLDDITSFSTSPLYEHMDFKKSNSTFLEQLKQELLNCFQDKETYGFLEGNERWHKIIQNNQRNFITEYDQSGQMKQPMHFE